MVIKVTPVAVLTPTLKKVDTLQQNNKHPRRLEGSVWSGFYHPSRASEEYRSTREERRHYSNFISEERTPDVQVLNEFVDSAYNSADQTSRCPEKLSTNTEVRTTQKTKKKRTTTPESEDEDVSDVRHQTRKTETDAKVSKTPHPFRRSDDSKRRTAEADAKVSSTQHSPRKSNSSRRSVRHRTSSSRSRRSRRPSRCTFKISRRRKGRIWPNKAKPDSASLSESSSSKDEEDILSAPKHMMKPPKFDGQTSFETFWAQFTNCAEYNKWSRAQKLAYLRNSLEKEVANIFCR